MELDGETWQQVADLFDKLAPLDPSQRQDVLASIDTDPTVRAWIQRLLQAHDAGDPVLVDRALEGIVADLCDGGLPDQRKIEADIVGRRFGPWKAVREIGRGGMGVVLLAERADGQYQKQVAIKLIPKDRLGADPGRDLRSEIRLLARLEHPDIARLLDGGITEDGIAYLVMEHVDGVPIGRHCDTTSLPVRECMWLMVRVARAVGYSHRQFVVHRDIKPSNILVTREGAVKLVDFGIGARLQEGEDTATPLAILARCTPSYASPEQLAGQAPRISDDVFALGVVLFELVSGQRLRDAGHTTRLLLGTQTRAPTALSFQTADRPGFSGNADLRAICDKALSPEASRRYADADSLADDLENWLTDLPVAARDGGRAYRAGKWFRRNRWVASIGVVAALSLLIGSGMALWQSSQAQKASARAESEAARAIAALARSEESLRQARTISAFLQDLFRATNPDRPRDELPSTEDILARGAERALAETGLDASSRIELLLTIARVYLAHSQNDAAGPLIDTALSLAEKRRSTHPADLAGALYVALQRDVSALSDEETAARLREIDAMLGTPETDWDTYVFVRVDLAYLLHTQHEMAQAWEILSALRDRIASLPDVSDRTRLYFLTKLLSLQKDSGNMDDAAATGMEMRSLLERTESPTSIAIAQYLASMGLLEFNRGNYAESATQLQDAIALYDRIVTGPHHARATSHRTLGYSLLQLGRFEQGWENLRAGNEEHAAALGIDPTQFVPYWFDTGLYFGQFAGNDAEAETAFRKTMELSAKGAAGGAGGTEFSGLLLSALLCRTDRVTEGSKLLSDLEVTLQRTGQTPFQIQAELHNARAVCQFKRGDYAGALEEIENVISIPGNGRAVERTAILVLKARILHILDDFSAASVTLNDAERIFLGRGIPDHPHLARIQSAREELRWPQVDGK